jgi:hypothetical protein
MLSIYAYRTVDDGQIAAYVSLGTVSEPESPRKFLWDDAETEDAGAALAAIVRSWAWRHLGQEELPFG